MVELSELRDAIAHYGQAALELRKIRKDLEREGRNISVAELKKMHPFGEGAIFVLAIAQKEGKLFEELCMKACGSHLSGKVWRR